MESHDSHADRPRPLIRTQAELEATWRRLMSPLGFGGSSIWMMYIDADDRATPVLTEIQEADEPPGLSERAGLVRVLSVVAGDDPGGRWAFLRSRPGRSGPDPRDRAWAEALLSACHAAGVRSDVVHLATDIQLVPLPLDDLALPA